MYVEVERAVMDETEGLWCWGPAYDVERSGGRSWGDASPDNATPTNGPATWAWAAADPKDSKCKEW